MEHGRGRNSYIGYHTLYIYATVDGEVCENQLAA